MAETDAWFLLVQYKRAGRTAVTRFEDPAVAASAYSEAERKHQDHLHGSDRDVDVLLVGASSLEVVKDRYPSYFANARSRSGKVRKLLATLPPLPAH